MRTPEELAEIRAAALGLCAAIREHGYSHTAAGIWALVEDLLDEIDELRERDDLAGIFWWAVGPPKLDEDGRPPDARPQTG
jgi:hypothetical protein